jgi:hypothetical protein
MPNVEALTTSKNVAPANVPGKASGPRRARKNASKNEATFIFCLEAGNGGGGIIQLSKPDSEDEILAAAFKNDVPYFRIQKFNAVKEKTSDGLKIVGVPVE